MKQLYVALSLLSRTAHSIFLFMPFKSVQSVSQQGGARNATRLSSQYGPPRAGSDGRTNPLRHQRLCIDSPSRAASHTHTAGPEDQSCPRPVAELWRSDISERSCADVRVTSGGFMLP